VIEQTDAGYALTRSGRELLDHLRPLNDWANQRLR
jgi:DNA-binding HxlR family transcriptional regulator